MKLSLKRRKIPPPLPGVHVQFRFELDAPLDDGTPVCRIAVQDPDGMWKPPVLLIPGESLDVTVHLP